MSNWKKITMPIVLLFITLLIDGGVTFLFRDQLNSSIGLMVPRLIVIALVMLAFFLEPKQLFILSITFGFIYDSYYSGLLGVYIAAFVLISYAVIQLRQIINPYFYVMLLINIVCITLLELFVFGVYRAVGIIDVSLPLFLTDRLGATLVLNTGIFLIIGYPLTQWINVITVDNENKSGSNIKNKSLR